MCLLSHFRIVLVLAVIFFLPLPCKLNSFVNSTKMWAYGLAFVLEVRSFNSISLGQHWCLAAFWWANSAHLPGRNNLPLCWPSFWLCRALAWLNEGFSEPQSWWMSGNRSVWAGATSKEWSLSHFDKNKQNLMVFTGSFKLCGICNHAPLVLFLGILCCFCSPFLFCSNPLAGKLILNLCCLYTNALSECYCESWLEQNSQALRWVLCSLACPGFQSISYPFILPPLLNW